MRILVIGSGGREHALVWKLAQSPHATQLWCAPGNAGIAQERLVKSGALAECVNIGAEDLPRLAEIRAGLRQRVARSPLCDGRRFAENLMDVLRQAWREWVGRKTEASGCVGIE